MFQMTPPLVTERFWAASLAALLWALSVAAAVLWVLHLPRSGEGAPLVDSPVVQAPTDATAKGVLRALGQTPSDPSAQASNRLALLGVIAADSGHGSALLAVDGQPAQAFVKGQRVVEGWRLGTVQADTVWLEQADGARLRLALPATSR